MLGPPFPINGPFSAFVLYICMQLCVWGKSEILVPLSTISSHSFSSPRWPLLPHSLSFLLTCHFLNLDMKENMTVCLFIVWFVLLTVKVTSRFVHFLHIDIILWCGSLYVCTPFSLTSIRLWTWSLFIYSKYLCLRKSYSIVTALVYISTASAWWFFCYSLLHICCSLLMVTILAGVKWNREVILICLYFTD